MATCVVFLVTFVLIVDGYRLPIKVYEISKLRHQDSRVDVQYYDPEQTRINKNPKKNPNLALYIVKGLQSETDDDYKYSDDENVVIDKTRSLPVIIVPEKHAVIRKKPSNYRILNKLLHSALRSDGVEDKTAPPRHHVNYEYDYY